MSRNEMTTLAAPQAAPPTTGPVAARAIESPVGPLRLEATARGVRRIEFDGARTADGPERDGATPADPDAEAILDQLESELKDYFAGSLLRFTVSLDEEGTPFQRAVWARMRETPPGETVSYAQVAADIGRPGASRAVGQASGANPAPIVTPCHRVVATGGGLGGFGGGLDRKQWLLEHERAGHQPDESAGANTR